MDVAFLMISSFLLLILIPVYYMAYLVIKLKYHLIFKIIIPILAVGVTVPIIAIFQSNFSSGYYENSFGYELYIGKNKTIVYNKDEKTYNIIEGEFTADTFYKKDNVLELYKICKSGEWTPFGGEKPYNMLFIFKGKYDNSKHYVKKYIPLSKIKRMFDN